jgi:hypothetical protein
MRLTDAGPAAYRLEFYSEVLILFGKTGVYS